VLNHAYTIPLAEIKTTEDKMLKTKR
jgi:hypothetical protein